MTNPANNSGQKTVTNSLHKDSLKISTNANNAGIGNKLVTIFASYFGSFIVTQSFCPFTSFVKPALDKSCNRDNLIFRRDLQKLRHGGLPAGTVFWHPPSREKRFGGRSRDRWPAWLRHQRFLLIPATVRHNCQCLKTLLSIENYSLLFTYFVL